MSFITHKYGLYTTKTYSSYKCWGNRYNPGVGRVCGERGGSVERGWGCTVHVELIYIKKNLVYKKLVYC